MNVLQVVPELNAGGVERTTIEIVEALHKEGHVPHIVSAGGRLETELDPYKAVLHKFAVGSKNPFRMAYSTSRLMHLIKKHDIDIVHARSRAPAWPAWRAARETGRIFVTTYHGIYNAKSALKRGYNSVMAKGRIVIANSEFTKAHIIKAHGTDPDRIRVIPRGVDMDMFDPGKISAESVESQRREWGIRPDQKIILLPGRLTRWKGQETAIKALKDMPEAFVLVCLGDAQGRNQYVQELKLLAKSLGVQNRLKLPGHSTNMPTALMATDMVISTSIKPEAFGRVMAEAQAMGRPVIASALGGSLETVDPDVTGLLVPPGDPKALAKAVVNLSTWTDYNPIAARARIAKRFSKRSLQDATLNVYRDLLYNRHISP